MSTYRQGTILGLTVAETFIILTFLLLIVMLGLVQAEDPPLETERTISHLQWERPEEIRILVQAVEHAKKVQMEAEELRDVTEIQRNHAIKQAEEAQLALQEAEETIAAFVERERISLNSISEIESMTHEEVSQAFMTVQQDLDLANESVEEAYAELERTEQLLERTLSERNRAMRQAEKARMASEESKEKLASIKVERNLANVETELTHMTREELEQALVQAIESYKVARRGDIPFCWYWYETNERKRQRNYYAFDVAIYDDTIKLAPYPYGKDYAPPGGAVDDNGGTYKNESERLKIDALPYGKPLKDEEFVSAVKHIVDSGRNGQVRTFECVFSVRVWDKTSESSKRRWKKAYFDLIQERFNAYPVRDLPWVGVD